MEPRPKPTLPLLDLAKPTRSADGRREFSVRCRVPFSFAAVLSDVRVDRAKGDETMPEGHEGEGEGGEHEEGEHEPKMMGGGSISGPVIHGVASSTGRDSYGTEMSRAALDSMAGQFRSGQVVYLPKHPTWSGGGGEWDDVIGYVVDGEVVRAEVEKPSDPTEVGYACRVKVQLDEKTAKCSELCDRLEGGHKIGQSIGGWFTELRFIYADGDDPDDWDTYPERIVVEDVELDHLAATRMPANTDSWIEELRSSVRDAHDRSLAAYRSRVARAAPPAVPVPQPAVRSEVAPASPEPAPAVVVDPAQAAPPEAQAASPVEPAEPSARDEAPVPLDTGRSAGEDTAVAGPDARGCAPGTDLAADPPVAHQEPPMPTDTERIDALSAQISEITAALRALAPAPKAEPAAAPAPAPANDELASLRAKYATLEAQLGAVLAEPQRRGVVVGDVGHLAANPTSAEREFDAIVRTADESGVRHLSALCKSPAFRGRRLEVDGPAKVTRGQLESDLHALCNAALDDGEIVEPAAYGSWRNR